MRLVLFDIDGTLLHTNGLSKDIFCQAISIAFERPIIWQGYPDAATRYTDTAMALDLLRHSGFAGEVYPKLDRAFEIMGELWTEHQHTADIHLFDGVHNLIKLLCQVEGCELGLLTANGRPSAWGKLRAAHLDHYPFELGAYGNEAADRNDLPPIALERAQQMFTQNISGKDIIIVGDTPADIACARVIGAQVVAVATGRYTTDDLATHNPDVLLETLEDTRWIKNLIYP